MTDRIPLTASPQQRVSVTLAGQRCVIELEQRSTGLYINLALVGVPILTGRICRDRVGLVRTSAFMGDLAFIDTQGTNDPDYTGLGGRYQLVYIP